MTIKGKRKYLDYEDQLISIAQSHGGEVPRRTFRSRSYAVSWPGEEGTYHIITLSRRYGLRHRISTKASDCRNVLRRNVSPDAVINVFKHLYGINITSQQLGDAMRGKRVDIPLPDNG